MTYIEAKKRCEELNKQILIIRKKYDFGGFAQYLGEKKIKPLEEELDKLFEAMWKIEEQQIIDKEIE